jgi:hypothetical protein
VEIILVLHKSYDVMLCEENASECLPYARDEPKTVQVRTLLESRKGLLKCVSLGCHFADHWIFKMSFFYIGLKLDTLAILSLTTNRYLM